MEFLRHCPTCGILGAFPTLQSHKWQHLMADPVLKTKRQNVHVPGGSEDRELDPVLSVGTVQQERGGGCKNPDSCLEAPLEVVLLWGSCADSRGGTAQLGPWYQQAAMTSSQGVAWLDQACLALQSFIKRALRSNFFPRLTWCVFI